MKFGLSILTLIAVLVAGMFSVAYAGGNEDDNKPKKVIIKLRPPVEIPPPPVQTIEITPIAILPVPEIEIEEEKHVEKLCDRRGDYTKYTLSGSQQWYSECGRVWVPSFSMTAEPSRAEDVSPN